MTTIPAITIDQLLARYRGFLVDAYGVLVSTAGALPGAARFIDRLRANSHPFLIVTNDSSRLPETASQRYAGFGVRLSPHEILTSGSLLTDYFSTHNLVGSPCIVLGTPDSHAYVRQAGGDIVPPSTQDATTIVIGDDDGYAFRETVDEVLTVLFHRFDRDLPTHLVLPNPDLIYLRGRDKYGITSGTVAGIFEAALELRYPRRGLQFTRLGKPNRPMFETAVSKLGCSKDEVVMIGDQLATDIAGAQNLGIDSVLISTGINRAPPPPGATVRPTYALSSLLT